MKCDDLWDLPLQEYLAARWKRAPQLIRDMAASYTDIRTGSEAIWTKQYYEHKLEQLHR